MELPTNRDVIEGVLEVDGETPHRFHNPRGYGTDPLHTKPWNYHQGIQNTQVYDEPVRAVLLRDNKEPGEEQGLGPADLSDNSPGKKDREEFPNDRKLGFLRQGRHWR